MCGLVYRFINDHPDLRRGHVQGYIREGLCDVDENLFYCIFIKICDSCSFKCLFEKTGNAL